MSLLNKLILTVLPVLEGTAEKAPEGVGKGAYVLSSAKGETVDGILMTSGSEVKLALDVQAKLAEDGIQVSVVSAPSLDLFEKQDVEYKEAVLPNNVRNSTGRQLHKRNQSPNDSCQSSRFNILPLFTL
jgi:transketolase